MADAKEVSEISVDGTCCAVSYELWSRESVVGFGHKAATGETILVPLQIKACIWL